MEQVHKTRSPIAACDQPSTLRIRRPSSLSEQLSLCFARIHWRHPKLCGLFLELRSFFHRILPIGSAVYRPHCDTGLVYREQSGFLYLNTKTQARTDYIQTLLASRRWLSPSDLGFFLEGWNEGCRFGSDLRGTQENTVEP